MAICSICKTRHAIVFTSRFENGQRVDEGFCLKCAYESGIAGMADMFKGTGVNADNVEEISNKVEEMVGSSELTADPGDFLKQLVSGINDMDFNDDAPYEFDEDSTAVGVADSDESYNEGYDLDRPTSMSDFMNNLFGSSSNKSSDGDSADKKKIRQEARTAA